MSPTQMWTTQIMKYFFVISETVMKTTHPIIKMLVAALSFIGFNSQVQANDTLSTASRIYVNTTYAWSINPAGDVDYAKFRVPSAGTFTVYTTGSMDSYGRLYNSSGSLLKSNDDQSSSNYNFKIQYEAKTAGDYYIRVNHYSRYGTGTYGLAVDFNPGVSYGKSIWNEALRAYNNGERTYYKGEVLADGTNTYCARHVRLVHDLFTAKYASAVAMCSNYANKGLISKTGTPPVGATLCYTGAMPGTAGYGHAAIADGTGQELGVTSLTTGVTKRASTLTATYYQGYIKADDFKANY